MSKNIHRRNTYKGQKLVKYILLPVAACLTMLLLISFTLHLIDEDTKASGSEDTSVVETGLESSKSIESTESSAETLPPESEITSSNTERETETSSSTQFASSSTTASETTASTTPEPGVSLTYPNQPDLVIYNGLADPRSVVTAEVRDPNSLTAIVNKCLALPADFEPAQLETVIGAEQFQLRSEAYQAWLQMKNAYTRETGNTLHLNSAYRSFNLQIGLFNSALSRKGIIGSVGYNAYQGRSEHQLGLAVDVYDSLSNKTKLSFADTPAYTWLVNNCSRFGFVQRYPAHKTHITDYGFEPWHYRYLGVELAKHLTDNDLTLEEYYGLGPLTEYMSMAD